MIMTNNYWYGPNHDWNNQSYNNQPYNRYSRISIEDAMDIAMEQLPGEVIKVELDTENGRLVYEVDIITAQGIKYEIEIDAQTGRIVNIKRD